ncbi:MAG: guanylate kinase [bacterium]
MKTDNDINLLDLIDCDEPPLLLIFSAPSGAGKSTICRNLLDSYEKLVFSVSTTTRAPRAGEIDGQDYHFVNESVFKKMIDNNAFLEWANVHGEYYGTSRQAVLDELKRGNDVMLDIDVQGGKQIKKLYPDAVMVFIAPPSMEELENRLRSRNTETEAEIRKRLKNSRSELMELGNYDYLVVNDSIETAVARVQAIRIAEKTRLERIKRGRPRL